VTPSDVCENTNGQTQPCQRISPRLCHQSQQWYSIAERAPDDATAAYLHGVFEPSARAIDGPEKVLAGLGLLDQALALDLRRPQDYFGRMWNTGFPVDALAAAGSGTEAGQQWAA
jgi:hypothetical protein